MNKKTRISTLILVLLSAFSSAFLFIYGLMEITEGKIMLSIFGCFFLLYGFLFIHIIGHEIGHMVAGLISGYNFLMFRVFKYSIYKTDSGLRFGKYDIPGTLGQALMTVDPSTDSKNFPFLFYNLGGVIFNILSSILAIIIGLYSSNGYLKIAIGYAIIGVYLAIVNLIRIPGLPNDGENIRNIKESQVVRENFYNLLQGAKDSINGKISHVDNLSEHINDKDFFKYNINQNILLNEVSYQIYNGDFDKVKELLNISLSSSHVQGLMKNMLNVEALYLAILENNKEKVNKIISSKEFHKFLNTDYFLNNLRTNIAYLKYVGDKENYNKKLDFFYEMKDEYPFTGEYKMAEKILKRDVLN